MDSNQILHSDKDHQITFVGVQIRASQIQDGRRSTYWKDRKITIYQQRFDRSPRNLAWWCISTLLTIHPITFQSFKNPRRRPQLF